MESSRRMVLMRRHIIYFLWDIRKIILIPPLIPPLIWSSAHARTSQKHLFCPVCFALPLSNTMYITLVFLLGDKEDWFCNWMCYPLKIKSVIIIIIFSTGRQSNTDWKKFCVKVKPTFQRNLFQLNYIYHFQDFGGIVLCLYHHFVREKNGVFFFFFFF